MKAALLAALIMLLCGCESLFFHPDKALRYHPDLCAASPQNVLFKAYDNHTLLGWYFKSENQPAKGTVFFLHGNAQNMSFHIHSLLWLLNSGYNIFTFDYRGYGVSEGEPDIKGVVDDSSAALDFLLSGEIPDVDKVIVLGQSMGGALAIDTVATTKHQGRISALITDSAFASWRRIYREKAGEIVVTWPFQYPISWFINDDYAPEKYINQIPKNIKILVIHNKQDKLVPYSHGEALFVASGKTADFWATDYEGHVTSNNYAEFRHKLLKYLSELPK